jgi:hypothetical protein
LSVGEHKAGYMRLDDAGDRERVPGRLEHHLIRTEQTRNLVGLAQRKLAITSQ